MVRSNKTWFSAFAAFTPGFSTHVETEVLNQAAAGSPCAVAEITTLHKAEGLCNPDTLELWRQCVCVRAPLFWGLLVKYLTWALRGLRDQWTWSSSYSERRGCYFQSVCVWKPHNEKSSFILSVSACKRFIPEACSWCFPADNKKIPKPCVPWSKGKWNKKGWSLAGSVGSNYYWQTRGFEQPYMCRITCLLIYYYW